MLFCTEVTDLCHTLSHSVILAPFALVHALSLHAPSVCVCSIVVLSVCVSVCGISDVPHLQPMSCVINLFRTKQGEGQQDRRKVRKRARKRVGGFSRQHIHISRTNPSKVVCFPCVSTYTTWLDVMVHQLLNHLRSGQTITTLLTGAIILF